MSNEILRVFKHSLSWTLHDKFLNNLIPILIIHERTILILKKYPLKLNMDFLFPSKKVSSAELAIRILN